METAVIMGAGPAGLTVAYELLTKTSIRPILIESEAMVGGLSKTINFKGNLIDIGGHRFFSKSDKIVKWWLQFLPLQNGGQASHISINYQNRSAEIDIPASSVPTGEKGAMMVRPRKSRIYYRKRFFDYPLQLNKKTFINLGFVKICKIGLSYTTARLFPLKEEKNLAQFFRNRFGKELYETFFKDYTEKVWGVPCEAIPADWGRQRIKDLNIGKAILHAVTNIFSSDKSLTQQGTSTSLIEQFLYPEKGPGQMWQAVADKVIELGGEIRLSTNVTNLVGGGGNLITAVICTDKVSGKSYEIKGDHFFSTVPLKELISGLQNIIIPEDVRATAKGLAYRDFIIVGLLLRKMAVSDQQNPEPLTDNWIYLQDKGMHAGRVQFFNNWSPYMVKDNNTVWMGVEYFCAENDGFWNKDDKHITDIAINEMANAGLISPEDILDATVIKIPKAYPSYTGTYDSFSTLQEFLNGIDNLYPVGRNGMHRYNNTDHSMMTAMVAVENLINGRKDKSNIWAINMEEDYHEENKS
ncbi:MAG: NAD(P)/FAD-dependent oxidoreductase [Ferruginibacter sp.]